MQKRIEAIQHLLLTYVPQESHKEILDILKNLLTNSDCYDQENFWSLFYQASEGIVERHVLYQNVKENDKDVLVVLRYKNAAVNFHYHQGDEIILVLDGYQETFHHKKYETIQPELFHKIKNDHLRYDFDDGIIVNKIGTRHSVRSDYCIGSNFLPNLT